MAANLTRSFFLWHKDGGIAFQLVTDLPLNNIPDDIREKIHIIQVQPGELGEGFLSKLQLDKLAGDGQTLFIDSDCLVYKNLETVFERFKGHTVSVTGNYISTGEWFGNVQDICNRFNVPHLPKFNGGIYYLENGPAAAKVYETARELEKRYDEIGFTRLRNRPNDEVLMALSMQLHQQHPIPDDGTILAEFVNFQSGVKSDLLNGVAELYNKPGHSMYQPGWHLKVARPAIVHYLGYHNQKTPYITEELLLRYLFENKYPVWMAKLLAFTQKTLPYQITTYLKSAFRPAYRALFGVRKVERSERMID